MRTAGKEQQSSTRICDAGGGCEHSRSGGAVGDGLVNANEVASRCGGCNRASRDMRKCLHDEDDGEMSYTKLRGPVNLLESMPPKVSSPFVISRLVVGANEMPTSCASIRPCANALSVTVGTHADVLGKRVPINTDALSATLTTVETKCAAYRTSSQQGQCWVYDTPVRT